MTLQRLIVLVVIGVVMLGIVAAPVRAQDLPRVELTLSVNFPHSNDIQLAPDLYLGYVQALLEREAFTVDAIEWVAGDRLFVTLAFDGDFDLYNLLALFGAADSDRATLGVLLEFVDFSKVAPGAISEGACILTTEQVALFEASLPEGAEPPAYETYPCLSPDAEAESGAAVILEDGQPFRTVMTGAGLSAAKAKPYGQIGTNWAVNVTLRGSGGGVEDLEDHIANHPNTAMAIVLNGRLISYPTIQPGLSDSARAGTMDGLLITGNFTGTEAKTLASQLQIGTQYQDDMLPVPVSLERVTLVFAE